MANEIDEVEKRIAQGEIMSFMRKNSTNSVPCNILAKIAQVSGQSGQEIVSLFLETQGKMTA